MGYSRSHTRDSINLSTPSQLLDSPDLTPHFRKSLSVATHRLSARSGLYPACYELKDVVQEGEYPVNAGGFADIYKGKFQGRVATSKEAILWRQLLHPNVLTLFGLYRFQNRISIVTAWMENGDISTYLKKNPIAPRQRLATDVGKGLAYLHANGIIHGDLKGPNILVDDTGRARLADFGISSVSDSQIVAWTTQSSESTQAGGSVRWQAPELFAVGASDMDDGGVEAAVKNTMASDVYVGCVFFEAENGEKIFTGNVPFPSITRDSAVIFWVKSGNRPARPPSSSLSWTKWGLTENIWACIELCWKDQPMGRPSAAAVAKYLAVHPREDTQQELDTDMHLLDEFRRRMSESFEMITVEELKGILGTRLELTDQEVKDIIEQQSHPPTLGSNVNGNTLSEQTLSPSSQQSDEFVIHALNSRIAENNDSEAFLPLPSGYYFTPHNVLPAPNIPLSAQSNIFPMNLSRGQDLAQPTLRCASGGHQPEMGLSEQTASLYSMLMAQERTDDVMDLDGEENEGVTMGIIDRPLATTGRIANVSARLRKQKAMFMCPIPGCGSTFTRSFDLKGAHPLYLLRT
ncbi:hypothetical protein DXG01_005582 [Tephrocybe rancida]|nr:hypothetical protein DXG01_005582 [Tephrocybe rancida]